MAKIKRSKTQQGFMGMTIPQGMRLGKDEERDYLNSKKYIANFSTEGEFLRVPLNRAMRRHAKKMKIELKEAE
ncbi:hypothetical protein [Xenorhabdus hominickii]|uniref:Uncharacterized protein n=1 Tax=Xenorhabdus hominickii TaxID=351679 RepID=A0A1D7P4B0_XENHO|nr:hypothetical protein [Xenorhabdus hominickii]AOM39990.1 hypothetical protein A9255_05020 [Xenorhabdus hominickii]AOM42596.1 hypothetical protein A9255_19835 [Xenorhabdus hominickii]PHM52031.1 hypothetical protein Xhom_04680 [Xenorhabdus hominickii]PHM52242.1 hypothetical protein Xhom_04622 [Xenorhabdus hominickii]PHM52991.1 hypothetical protein Xhom_03873 [Xenorhabdus hominickii]